MEKLDFSHEKYRDTINDLGLSQFVPHVPDLPELDDWEEVTPTQIYVAPRGCPHLTSLSLANCVNLSRDALEGAIKKFEFLTELDLSGLDIKTVQGMNIQSISLLHLRISRLKNTTSRTFFLCTLNTPNLLSLCLAATYPLLDKLFEGEATPRLQTLDLSDCHLNNLVNRGGCLSLMRFLASPEGSTITTLLLSNCNLNDSSLNQVLLPRNYFSYLDRKSTRLNSSHT